MKNILGLCSAFSLLYGVHKPDKLLDRAEANGAQAVSICDLNNVYGVHTFLEAAKERNIRPVVGCALTANNEKSAVYCFVENRAGFSRLCEILTERNKDAEHFNPLPFLCGNSQGLVLASADSDALKCLSGRVKRLYAAITPADIRSTDMCRRLSIPLAFIDNSLFLEPGDYAVHRVLRAIDLLKTIGNLEPGDLAEKERILQPSKDMHRRLASFPEAARGTQEIAALCTFDNLFNGWIFPGYEPGKMQSNPLTVIDELRRRVYQGNADRYGELGDRELGRIDYELSIIGEKGFAPYFLIIDDIVKMANADDNCNTASGCNTSSGCNRTCGRGSGAASIVSYGLGITNVDPLRHNLYFERFLNPSRYDPPDLDIDFAWDERDGLIKAVIAKFGHDHCARVANHNMFRYRSALRETAKAYGFGDAEITRIERRLFQWGDKSVSAEPLWQEIIAIAEKIEGLPRGLGMHCGGLVITPDPVSRYAPVEKSAEGYPLLAWEKEGAEAAGFVKIDLLGNRSLAVIRDAVGQIKNGEDVQERLNRAVDDGSTIAALARGDSIGVFYIESPAMRQLQKKTNRGDFEHIVIHSSIIRPAANKFISEYVRRLKGGKWQPLHPRLEKILDESYGILCYQEDVSKTAVALAGFNEADADKLRKVIAKKMGGKKLAMYQSQFFDGCRSNKVAEETIQKIWEMMLSFDGYSFCKPHSASYAMVSYQSAYLRVHHPAEFMAAVLSNQGGYYRSHAYIAEIRRMRLQTIGPDINASEWKYCGISNEKANLRFEGIGDEELRIGYRGSVVIGLMAVKGLSVSGAEAVITERERGGAYASLDDFSRRVRLNRDDIIALCPAGVFDNITKGVSRHLQARILLSNNREQGTMRNGELFNSELTPFNRANGNKINPHASRLIPHCNDLWEEYRALGFLRNTHPLALWKDAVLAVKYRLKALHIGDHVGSLVNMVGWQVTQKDVWTKDGLAMSFLSLEDETAMYETVIFPQVYEKYNKLLFDQQPLLVYGRVMNDQGAISLEVHRIEVLGEKIMGEAADNQVSDTLGQDASESDKVVLKV